MQNVKGNPKEKLRELIDDFAIEAIAEGKTYKQFFEIENESDRVNYLALYYENDSGREKINPVLTINAHTEIKHYLSVDEELTKQIKTDFKNEYFSGGWANWIQQWLIKRGYEIGEFDSNNTYNWGNHPTTIFEYTHFIDKTNGKEGLVIMWHKGKDVRVNYTLPEIWIGDRGSVEEFISAITPDFKTETAYYLGYDGDWQQLEKDLLQIIHDKVNAYKTKEEDQQSINEGYQRKQRGFFRP